MAEGEITVVMIERDTHKKMRVPEPLREAVARYEEVKPVVTAEVVGQDGD